MLRRWGCEITPAWRWRSSRSLHVADAAAAIAWYGRLGFTEQWVYHFDPGYPAFVSIARDRVRLFLSEHRGDARPETLVVLEVRDLDAVVAEFRPARRRTCVRVRARDSRPGR